VAVSISFDQTTRSIIDCHAEGFCKLIVDLGRWRTDWLNVAIRRSASTG
jgi:hypothetical protein